MPINTTQSSSYKYEDFKKIFKFQNEIFLLSYEEIKDSFDFYKNHSFDYYLIVIITEGNIEFAIDYNKYNLNVGDTIVIRPHQNSILTNLKNFDGHFIGFTENFLFNYLLNKNDLIRDEITLGFYDFEKISLSDYTLKHVLGLVDLIKNELLYKHDGSQIYILQNLLYLILINLNREIKKEDNQEDKHIKFDYQYNLFMRFKSLISQNIKHSFDVQRCAEKLNVNKRTLQLVTKNVCGETPKKLINKYLVLEIKRQLLNPNLQIQDIAFKLEFVDATVLSKFFKKQTGLSPQKFRKYY